MQSYVIMWLRGSTITNNHGDDALNSHLCSLTACAIHHVILHMFYVHRNLHRDHLTEGRSNYPVVIWWKTDCYHVFLSLFFFLPAESLPLNAHFCAVFTLTLSRDHLSAKQCVHHASKKFTSHSFWALRNVLSWQPEALPRHLASSNFHNRRVNCW